MSLRIEIVKSPDGRDRRREFSNEYFIWTGLAYDSEAAEKLAKDIADAERKIYYKRTAFMRAVITHTNSYGLAVKGDQRSFPLEGSGNLALPAGVAMAPADIVALIGKVTPNGPVSYTPYKHCVTAPEYEDYLTLDKIPDRFRDPGGVADAVTINFIEALRNTIGVTNMRHGLPLRKTAQGTETRLITRYVPGGISIYKATRARDNGVVNTREGIQQQINELASRARYIERGDANGALPDAGDGVIGQLKTKALALYNSLPPEEKSRIKWPTIFDNNPLTNGA